MLFSLLKPFCMFTFSNIHHIVDLIMSFHQTHNAADVRFYYPCAVVNVMLMKSLIIRRQTHRELWSQQSSWWVCIQLIRAFGGSAVNRRQSRKPKVQTCVITLDKDNTAGRTTLTCVRLTDVTFSCIYTCYDSIKPMTWITGELCINMSHVIWPLHWRL